MKMLYTDMFQFSTLSQSPSRGWSVCAHCRLSESVTSKFHEPHSHQRALFEKISLFFHNRSINTCSTTLDSQHTPFHSTCGSLGVNTEPCRLLPFLSSIASPQTESAPQRSCFFGFVELAVERHPLDSFSPQLRFSHGSESRESSGHSQPVVAGTAGRGSRPSGETAILGQQL